MGKQKYRKIGSWNNKLCIQYALHIEIIYILSLTLHVNFKTLQPCAHFPFCYALKNDIASIVHMGSSVP